MSANLNDRNATVLSDMAYLADKLGNLNTRDRENLNKVFYNDEGLVRDEIKQDKDLNDFAQRIESNKEFYRDVLENTKLVGTANDTNTGYKGIAIQDLRDKSIIIGNAGTDDGEDFISGGQMVINKIPDQLSYANSFVNGLSEVKINNESILTPFTMLNFTGHSLGGSLSQLMTVRLFATNNIGVAKTFEAYGTEGIMNSNPELAMLYSASKSGIDGNITNFTNNFDPVATFGVQIGKVIGIADVEKVWNMLPTDPSTGQKLLGGIIAGLAFWHPLTSYSNVQYDSNGNIISGSWGPFKPDEAAGLINKELNLNKSLCEKMYGWMHVAGGLSMLDSIMAANSQYKSAEAAFITPPRRDPITVDLDNDGVETTNTAGGVYFDLDGNGTKEKTGWVKADDGFLVMDRDGNGAINSGKELFGDQTIIKTADGKLKTAETGFEALSAEDSNGDKIIDSSDENFNKLKVWKDANQDGISQANELQSLEDARIKKIHLDYLTVNADDGHGNIQTRTSGFEFSDGRTGVTGEFLFNRDTIDTQNSDFSNVSTDILSMPYLRGFGEITDLHHAMTSDESLKALVTEFCNTGSTSLTNSTNYEPETIDLQIGEVLTRKFESIFFKWCGVDAIDTNSRGGNIDARRLAVLEKIFAENFEGFGAAGTGERSANPNAAAAAQLDTVYNNIKDRFFANMLLQSHLKEYVMLGAVELSENGEIKVNEQAADIILNFQKKTADYRLKVTNGVLDESALPQTLNGSTLTSEAHQLSTDNDQLFFLKFYALASTVKTLGTAAEKEEFVTYFASKGEGIYADGLKGMFSGLIIGSKSNDTLSGDNSNNRIYGFENNDTIYGKDGYDTLIGGKGNDYLSGGDNNDTYIYRRGDGNDVILEGNNERYTGASYDKVVFEDLKAEDIQDIVREGDDIVLKFRDMSKSNIIP